MNNLVGTLQATGGRIQLAEELPETGQTQVPTGHAILMKVAPDGNGENAQVLLDLSEIRRLKRLLSESEQLLILRYQQDMRACNLELAF